MGCRGQQAIRPTRNGYDHVADRLTSELTTAIYQATSAAPAHVHRTQGGSALISCTHTPHSAHDFPSIFSCSPLHQHERVRHSRHLLSATRSSPALRPSLIRPVRRSFTTYFLLNPQYSLAGSKPQAFTPQHARTSPSLSTTTASSSVPSKPCTHAHTQPIRSTSLAFDEIALEPPLHYEAGPVHTQHSGCFRASQA